jgi:hypothetical protein
VDGDKNVIWAGRLQFDFWDPENGYYLNSTYYGDKNLIALGVATQAQADATGSATAEHNGRLPSGEEGAQWRGLHHGKRVSRL